MRTRPLCPLPESKPRAPSSFTPEQAREEATRCLSLNVCQGCEVCQLICPDQAISKDKMTDQPVIDLRYCKGCGLCAHLCPKGAITMVLEHQAG